MSWSPFKFSVPFTPICSYRLFQMILSDPSEGFKCIACKSPRLLQTLDSLKMHFSTEHGVVNLLTSPASRTLVPPSAFSCTCSPSESCSSCLFCGVTGLLGEEETKYHLGSRHGAVFQGEWKLHSSQHCRYLGESSLVCTGMATFAGAWQEFSGELELKQSGQNL